MTHWRENVLLNIQSTMNSCTVTVNSFSSTCNRFENRLLFIRESTFQALQVGRTNLEKVNNNVTIMNTGNRHSQFLDLDQRAYNFPRPTPPMGKGNRRGNSAKKS